MIDLDIALLLVAGVTLVGLVVIVVAQLAEEVRRAQWAAEHAERRAVSPAAVGPTERLACCDAPDVPDGADYCIACGRQVQP